MNVFQIGAISTAFQLAWLLIAVVALVFLVRLYQRTQMSGFLWLLFAVVVWPFLSRLSIGFLPVLLAQMHEPAMQMTMFTVVMTGLESLIDAGLLLAAAILLDRQHAAQSAMRSVVAPTFPATYPNTPPTQF